MLENNNIDLKPLKSRCFICSSICCGCL